MTLLTAAAARKATESSRNKLNTEKGLATVDSLIREAAAAGTMKLRINTGSVCFNDEVIRQLTLNGYRVTESSKCSDKFIIRW